MTKKRQEIDDKYKWDLTRIYKNQDDFESDFKKTEQLLEEIPNYKGIIMNSSDNLYEVLKLEKQINQLISKLYIYAALKYYEDMKESKAEELFLKAEKLYEEVTVKTSFINPEILKKDYKELEEKEELDEYKFILEKMYRYQKYTLSEDKEELIANALNAMGTGADAFKRLDNADLDLGYIKDENGNKVKYNNQLYASFIRSSNRNLRKRAFNQMYEYYKNRKSTIAALYAGNVKENIFLSNVRGYNSPLEQSLYKDNIEVNVYKNLIECTHNNLSSLHKYFEIKAKLLKINKMHLYDVYAEPEFEIKEHIEYEDAKKIINEALKPLGEQYINDLQKAYEEKWIDVFPNEGKKSGAYAWGPYRIPVVSLNYDYKIEDVSTMAHELGHAMHSYYSENNQTPLYSDYPIFLAEIASTVNESLLSHYQLKNAKTKNERIRYILNFLEKFRTTIFRQTMFAEFEMNIHDLEQQKIPLTEEKISEKYYGLNKLYFGKNVVCDEFIKYEWMRIPHFYTSFYVYKYATGLSSALAISSDILNNKDNAKEAYLEFLKIGGSKYPLDTLKTAGVDLTTSKTIQKAFDMFNDMVLELEKLVNE